MKRTIYEAYNDKIIVQFLEQADAIAYANKNEMQWREIEQELVEMPPPPSIITPQDWLNVEQSLYQHKTILQKAANSTGNGFAFLLKVLTDGKTTGASENALLLAINMLLPAMAEPLQKEEIDFINQILESNHFTIRI